MTRKFKYLIPAIAIVLMGAAFQFGGLKLDITSQISSVSPIILSSASTQVQRVTGSANQVIKLPDATTLRAGYFYYIGNESSGTLTISNSSSTQIVQLAAGNTTTKGAFLFLTSSSTTGGPWMYATLGATSGGGGSGTTYHALITMSDTSSCAITTQDSNNWIASIASTGGGSAVCELTITGAIFSATPWCVAASNGVGGVTRIAQTNPSSATSVFVSLKNTSAAADSGALHVICGDFD